MRAVITADLDFLLGDHFQLSEDLYHQCCDSKWAAKQLDTCTDDTVAEWNLNALLHIAALNREMTARAVPMLRKYVAHFSTE